MLNFAEKHNFRMSPNPPNDVAQTAVTYVCCANSDEQLKQMLLPSFRRLERAGLPVSLLLIDARGQGYRSAAEAFNRELDRHRPVLGEVLVFCHQDFAFETAEFHRSVVELLEANPLRMVGAAGRAMSAPHTRLLYSNLRALATRERICGQPIDRPTRVCSVDECCFALRTDVFFRLRFDERACNHWHLYAVDLGYALQSRLGGEVVVTPAPAFHKMENGLGLTADTHFLRSLWRLVRKYHGRVPELLTTCARVSTGYLHGGGVIAKMWLEQFF